MENQEQSVETVTTAQPTQVTVKPLAVQNGDFVPTNAVELNALLTRIATGGGFPSRFDNQEKRLAAYNLAHSLMGARWQLALNNIAEIKGQLSIYGELPSALAEQTKEVQEKHVYVVDQDRVMICLANGNIEKPAWAGVCVIQRKGRIKKEYTYTIDEAKNAGQYPAKKRDGSQNPDSPWMKFTKVMLMRKAMAMGVKFEFPDAMVGVPVAEYDYDALPDLVKEVTPLRRGNPDDDEIAEKIARMGGDH